MRRDLLKISEAVGVAHPALITADDVDILEGVQSGTSLRDLYGYQPDWGQVGPGLAEEVTELMLRQGRDEERATEA
jgi:hypothetical protein